MPIIGINNDIVSSNFVSSDLIDDTGIATPNDTIKSLCAATADYQLFVQLVNKMTLNETIDAYNFFDQFCINKALIKIIKNHMTHMISCKDHDSIIIDMNDNRPWMIRLDVPFNKLTSAKFVSIRKESNIFDKECIDMWLSIDRSEPIKDNKFTVTHPLYDGTTIKGETYQFTIDKRGSVLRVYFAGLHKICKSFCYEDL